MAAGGDEEMELGDEMKEEVDDEWEGLAPRLKSRREADKEGVGILAVDEEFIDEELAMRIEAVVMEKYSVEGGPGRSRRSRSAVGRSGSMSSRRSPVTMRGAT